MGIGHWALGIGNRALGIGHYQLPITYYQLPITYYQLPITYYLLPIPNSQFPIPYSLKIIKAFQDSRQIYHELDSEYRTIEKNMENLQQQFTQGTILTASQLQELQEQLKQLFCKAVTYTRLLRKLEDFDNTIAINLYNYNDILQKICVMIEGDKEELSILNNFEIKIAPYMRSQIAGDLGYFRHGTSLIEQAIASIRGIVEIEQARNDRTNQLELRNSEIAE